MLGNIKIIFLSFITVTEERETGANLFVKSLHMFISYKATTLSLPSKLFIKVVNCCLENKNCDFLEYVKFPVTWGIFAKGEVAMLPAGHTHEEVDIGFGHTSNYLCQQDAIKLSDLHERLREVYNCQVPVF